MSLRGVTVFTAGSLALTLALATGAAPPSSAADEHPDSVTQPEQDGCGRDPLGLVAGTSPQWVYVNRDPTPRYVRGVARNARPSGDDLFTAHDSYDWNIFFDPDPAYDALLGTANVSTVETQAKDEQDTMEIEWEQGAAPPSSWATAGDRVEVMGSWIWDCAHWRAETFTDPTYFQPGTQPDEPVTGERTEIHPPRMTIVHRRTPSVSARGEATTDALISSDGTRAKGVEDAAANFCATPPQTCDRWFAVNDRDYAFDVSAPPRPAGARRLVWQAVDQGSVNAPAPVVTTKAAGIHVVVPFNDWGTDGERMVFAKRFLVGWDVPQRVRRYRVTVQKFHWLTLLDGLQPFTCVPTQPCTDRPQQSRPPDDLNLYVDAAGQWRQLVIPSPRQPCQPTPGLFCVNRDDVITLNETFDLYIADGAAFRVLGRVRECDQPTQRECPVPQEMGLSEDGGIFDHAYRGGAASVPGVHVGVGVSSDCMESTLTPCYELTYRIDDLGTVALPRQQPPAAAPRGPIATTGGTWSLAGAAAAATLGALALRRRRRRLRQA